jgi:hypothetical protein
VKRQPEEWLGEVRGASRAAVIDRERHAVAFGGRLGVQVVHDGGRRANARGGGGVSWS